MHEVRQRLQRAGLDSSASDSTRSLARNAQERWATEPALAPLAANLSDWLLDMERLRYAPSSAPQTAELKTLRQRWQTLKKQRWPTNVKN